MSRKSSRPSYFNYHSYHSTLGGRDVFTIAKPSRLPRPLTFQGFAYNLVEDRRTFHPERAFRPALLFSGRPSRTTFKPSSVRYPGDVPARVMFRAPPKVLVCVRRQARKEVLHALRKTGRVGQRAPRRNLFSSVSCKD